MKINVICISKTSEKYLQTGIELYLGRLKHYVPIEFIEIPDIKNAKNMDFEQIKNAEGELIVKKIDASSRVILLDDKGKDFTSIQFSNYIEKQQLSGVKIINFIIGGPYGFSEKVYALANEKISLSKMTFSHQLIRVIFFEQLYRAYTILKNEPYHHE
ncbi:MAG: 23S rRNA (pseudouridine(1915)-N(3))-methyltransferase RlmH [Bacteroidota bacterium]